MSLDLQALRRTTDRVHEAKREAFQEELEAERTAFDLQIDKIVKKVINGLEAKLDAAARRGESSLAVYSCSISYAMWGPNVLDNAQSLSVFDGIEAELIAKGIKYKLSRVEPGSGNAGQKCLVVEW